MTPNRQDLLSLLATDDTHVAGLVETLRHAAGILDETSLTSDVDRLVGFKLAPKLRDLAQRLCDHSRTSGDGTCRYCELLLTEAE